MGFLSLLSGNVIKWVVIFIVGSGAIFFAIHVWDGYLAYHDLKDQVDSLTRQQTTISKAIPKHQEKALKERERLSTTFKESKHANGAQDPVPESTRLLYLKLWGQDSNQ